MTKKAHQIRLNDLEIILQNVLDTLHGVKRRSLTVLAYADFFEGDINDKSSRGNDTFAYILRKCNGGTLVIDLPWHNPRTRQPLRNAYLYFEGVYDKAVDSIVSSYLKTLLDKAKALGSKEL